MGCCGQNIIKLPTGGAKGPDGLIGEPGVIGETGLQGTAGVDGVEPPFQPLKFSKDYYWSPSQTVPSSFTITITAVELTAAGMLKVPIWGIPSPQSFKIRVFAKSTAFGQWQDIRLNLVSSTVTLNSIKVALTGDVNISITNLSTTNVDYKVIILG